MAKFITATLTLFLVLMGGISIFLPIVLAPWGLGSVDLVWYFLSFLIGLSMIILPSALPVALLAVPIATKDGMLRGVSAVLSFGLGVMITLSFYGVLISLIGKAGLSFLGLHTEDVLYWMYFFSGIFVYILALSEVGILRSSFRSHVGAVRENGDHKHPQLELFFLGIFLGNIGVGGMHSGIPLLFLDAGASGNILHGWLLFFVNAIGRIFPLLLLVVLSVRGVPALEWLMIRKEVIRRLSGWVMLAISVFLMTLGFFGYDWLVGNLRHEFSSVIPMSYVLLGNTFLVVLLLIPIWVSYLKERARVLGGANSGAKELQSRLDDLHEERAGIDAVLGVSPGFLEKAERHISHKIEGLEKEKHIASRTKFHTEESANGLPDEKARVMLRQKRNRGIILSGVLVLSLLFLPYELGLTQEVSPSDLGTAGVLHE
ncbi:MAG: hypothetical protein A2494_03035 [Candidatus Lloydbacteria bacterium RIFOXYC12_FULL_46_25]|uniref:Cytochrome C biogenesis protein transmembrane domain-containing protein n=1 Tax=Candidatus Lloydbacteria bacterium RIFOXYC12_FULL_46_25 TaxID=1798670 RepID=A0A1G2DXH6_9BACT|nr:MAG: hypothetical protein A2494_03035 [Candidatus Lloydbacteria bacterium RIFOXYC12_FULL_46_25]